MADESADKRQHTRLDTQVKVEVTVHDPEQGQTVLQSAQSRNVSTGGLLVTVDRPLEMSEFVIVHFTLPGRGEPLDFIAKVMRVSEAEDPGKFDIGLQFVDVIIGDFEKVKKYILGETGKTLEAAPAGEEEQAIADKIEKYDKAIESLEASGDTKGAARTYNKRGIARKKKGDLEGAIEDYTSAVELDPEYAPACNNRARARVLDGDIDGAVQDYTKTIELLEAVGDDPNTAMAYSNRGRALHAKVDFEGAISDMNKAMELAPHQPRIPGRLALVVLEWHDDYRKARELIDEALIGIRDVWHVACKALIEMAAGEHKEADELLHEAEEMETDVPGHRSWRTAIRAWHILNEREYSEVKKKQARKMFEQALERYFLNDYAHAGLIISMRKLRKREDSRDHLKELRTRRKALYERVIWLVDHPPVEIRLR